MRQSLPAGRQGFSIVELLVYCGLLAIILMVVTNLFVSIINVQMESNSSAALASDGQYLLSRLTYDLRRATAITSPSLGSTSATLSATINGASYQFKLVDNNLVSSPGGQLNSYQNVVSNLSFTHLGSITGKEDTVQISFTLQSKITKNSGVESRNFSTTIGLRPN